MTNPTSNFGWQMPTSTDLVTDLPADFEVFGQAVDTDFVDLLGGTTGQVLSKTSATDLDFTWVTANPGDITGVTAGTGISGGGTSGTVTVSIDTAVTADLTTSQTLTNKTLTSPALTTPTISTLTTNGDLLYGTGSGALARTAIGSTGNVLTVSGGLPVWSAPAGGGKVLQVIQGTYSTAITNATNVYADTNLTATITPTLNTSKVLVLVSHNGCRKFTGNASSGAVIKLLRGVTDIALFSGFAGWTNADNNSYPNSVSVNYLDSPATTSATTYKTQFKNDVNASGVGLQNNTEVSTIILLEIGA
jgi:hypothetical protein